MFILVLFIVVLSVGCGNDSGSCVSEITGPNIINPNNTEGVLPLIDAKETNISFGARRVYEGKGKDDYNNIVFTSNGKSEIGRRKFRVQGKEQVEVSWFFLRPQIISAVKIDLSGSGVDSVELKYVGETNEKVFKTYKISGEIVSSQTKRIFAEDVIKSIWKVTLFLKGSDIDVTFESNYADCFFDGSKETKYSYDLMNYQQIFRNETFLKETANFGEAKRFSTAESINLTLKRFCAEASKENIETVLRFSLETRSKYRNYPIINRETSIICFEGTSNYSIDYAEYCRGLGVVNVKSIKGNNDPNAKNNFLVAIAESKGKTTVVIDSHGKKDNFEVNSKGELCSAFDLSMAIKKRESLYKFGELCFISNTCYSGDMFEQTLNYLYYNNEQAKTPIIAVMQANRDQLSWNGGGSFLFFPGQEALINPEILTAEDLMNKEEQEFYPNDFAFFVPAEVGKLGLTVSERRYEYGEGGIYKRLPILDLSKK